MLPTPTACLRHRLKRRLLAAVLLVLSVPYADGRSATQPATPPESVVALVAGEPRFQSLARAIETAGLSSALKGTGPFTLVAPTDDAFERLDSRERASLFRPQNKARLAAILKYHVLVGRWTADELVRAEQVETVNGQRLRIERSDAGVRVNDALLAAGEMPAGNGVVLAIDALLRPSEDTLLQALRKDDRLSAFAELVAGTDMAQTLAGGGPMTLLAPTNEAIAAVGGVEALRKDPERRANLFERHLIPERRVYLDPGRNVGDLSKPNQPDLKVAWNGMIAQVAGVTLLRRNVDTANGVLHVCDGILGPN